MRRILEVCANSLQSALNAQEAGTDRIELCENLSIGGTTPSIGTIIQSRKRLSIGINVLVRPRGGDFLYSDNEFDTIREDIQQLKKHGVNGVVCGILLPDGNIDIARTKELVELSKPLTFTFHRAFDFTQDPFRALEDIIQTGADHILTSGQQTTAIQGEHLIKELIKQSAGRIIIMPGSGVSAETIELLIETGANEFHMSGTTQHQSGMTFIKPFLSISDRGDDYLITSSDIEKIRRVIDLLNE